MKVINKWIYEYNSDIIVVTGGRRAERALFVNGELQDKKIVQISNELHGKLINGSIKAYISGFFKKSCKLYVNDILLTPARIEKKNVSEWSYRYNTDTITIINKILTAELYINGELQNAKVKIFRGSQYGGTYTDIYSRLDSGEEIKVKIKELLGDWCRIYIDNELQNLKEIDETGIKYGI